MAECLERESPWMAGELAFWLYLIGAIETIPEGVAEPYRLAGSGEWEKAALFWEDRGIPYDRAIALSMGSNEAKLEALGILDELGARPIASRLRSELTAAGVSGVPRGPTRATRENPFGLTPRQMDVLRLMAENMTNSEIADRLFVSSRTVDHHVSAVLGKLGATTRAEAVTIGDDNGILDATR
jgi:DNA-binding CsgD family transcriptional regulator